MVARESNAQSTVELVAGLVILVPIILKYYDNL